jgi:hypothetical protein
MFERIYTIPVNEAFDESLSDTAPIGSCPFCRLQAKLEQNELDLILGASMMEPDIRIQTNKKGFCANHFDQMLHAKNRLGLTLILQSHLDEILNDVQDGLLGQKGANAVARIEKLNGSCYVCDRIEASFSKMLGTAAYLHSQDSDFRRKFASQSAFCLPHYRRLLIAAKAELNKKEYLRLTQDAQSVLYRYFDELRADVAHFVKKFDYRYEQEPWGNAKDAPDRAIRFLKSGTLPEKK